MLSIPNIQAMLRDLTNQGVYVTAGVGVPTNGTSGTGVGLADKGSLYVNVSTGVVYSNTGTLASPTWSSFTTALTSVTGDITFAGSVASIGANKVLSSMLDTSLLQTVTGTILSANITGTGAGQLGHANGVILVPAGGAHVINELVSVVLINAFSVAAYTAGGNLTVNIGGGGAALTGLISNANFIQSGANKIIQFAPLAAVPNVYTENNPLNLVSTVAPTQPGTAAGVFRYKVTYRQWATGL